MKMVSAAKLKGDENRLKRAVAFNAWTKALCTEPQDLEFATFEELPAKTLLVPFTSEKGLCGGVNSYITRATRSCVAKLTAQGKSCDIAVIGDKGRAQLRRTMGSKLTLSNTELSTPGNYLLASALATELMVPAQNYDAIVLLYNKFVNPAVYKQYYKVLTPFSKESSAEGDAAESSAGDGEGGELMEVYEFDADKDEAMYDLYEYVLASQVFHSLMDAATSEQSSRMTAMENASKNAKELIGKLTLKYNRARQARITTELIEIISGASAIEKK
jgi:F-type H+-transporting ATPase subunit gamma